MFGNIKTSDDYSIFKETIDGIMYQGKNKVILNCEKVHFINSSGLGRLILAAKKVKENGGVLIVTNLSEELRELFSFTMLDTKIKIFNTEEDAVADLQ